MGKIAIVVTLLALLALSVWFAAASWVSLEGPPLPTEIYVAMALGVGFSFVVGAGLMALLFFSSRRGYDEPAKLDDGGKKE